MLATLIVILAASSSLLFGAAWGIVATLPRKLEGFLIALAGGALIYALIIELIEPAIAQASLGTAMAAVTAGAIVFTVIDYLVDEQWGHDSGGGLLVAITLDGVPENLALGVALIGASVVEVAALTGAIVLSNLPEAAGGASEMIRGRHSKGKVFGLWASTAALLSAAAIAGNVALADAPAHVLAIIRCFAAGAVVASLATEVFPKAYQAEHHLSGIATVIGLVVAYVLGSFGG